MSSVGRSNHILEHFEQGDGIVLRNAKCSGLFTGGLLVFHIFPLINCILNFSKERISYYRLSSCPSVDLGNLIATPWGGDKREHLFNHSYSPDSPFLYFVPSNLTMCVLVVEIVSFPLADFVTT